MLCYTYHYLHGLDISVPRFFTVYGPAGRAGYDAAEVYQRLFEGAPSPYSAMARRSVTSPTSMTWRVALWRRSSRWV